MKKYLITILCWLFAYLGFGQGYRAENERLPLIGISQNATLHLVSPEPISYVDLSTGFLKGDLPLRNVLRVKVAPDSLAKIINNADAGIVTLTGETFIAQFRLYFLPPWENSGKTTVIDILSRHCKPIATESVMTVSDMRSHALSLLKTRKSSVVGKEDNYGIRLSVNQLYTAGDYIFLDLGIVNGTNLPFDIDELSFSVDDRKITKATNVQSVAVRPVWQLYQGESFKKRYRNIIVLKKLSFPENKVLNISLKEKQLSGRNLTLGISYRDILRADTF